jgi:hypothetical protein
MKTILLVASCLLISAAALADGKNLVACDGLDANGGPQKVVIRQDTGGQLVALFSQESFGGSFPTIGYKVEYQPPEVPRLGGVYTYASKNLTLRLVEDSASTSVVGYLTVPGESIRNEKLDCKVLE